MENPRIPYQTIADAVGISIHSVQRRIKALEEGGYILGYRACISDDHLGLISVMVKGWIDSGSITDQFHRISKDVRTEYIIYASGNRLFTFGLVTDNNEITAYVEMVKGEGIRLDPDIDLLYTVYPERFRTRAIPHKPSISGTDVKIIRQLSQNSRMSINAIAQQTGVSSKTVNRRLAKLIDDHIVSMYPVIDPSKSPSDLILLEIRKKQDVKVDKVVPIIVRTCSPYISSIQGSRNRPDQLFGMCWTETTKDLDDMMSSLERLNEIEFLTPHILVKSVQVDSVREEMMERYLKDL
jgi:DNA-binding Lrp family transcriptional regulator